jgi:hypothetical protein
MCKCVAAYTNPGLVLAAESNRHLGSARLVRPCADSLRPLSSKLPRAIYNSIVVEPSSRNKQIRAMLLLPVQTELGYLLVYDLHVTKHPALPALRSQTWGPHDGSQPLHAVDVYVKHPVRCDRDVPATCVCCDSRVILVAYADGCWGSCSWFGKVSSTSSSSHCLVSGQFEAKQVVAGLPCSLIVLPGRHVAFLTVVD